MLVDASGIEPESKKAYTIAGHRLLLLRAACATSTTQGECLVPWATVWLSRSLEGLGLGEAAANEVDDVLGSFV